MIKFLLRFALCGIVAMGHLTAQGNSNISGRYWFDFGGEYYSFTPGSFDIMTNGLAEGFHTFHAYIQDGNDISATHTGWFLKQSKKIADDEQLICTFYVDGQPFQTQNASVGADGTICINLDMNTVDIGLHTLSLALSNNDGISLGFRNGLFIRVPSDLQRSTFDAYYYLDNEFKGKLSASGNNSSVVHLDIDTSSLSAGLHSVTIYLASPHGMATSVKSAWFIKIPEGGEGVKQYSYWINENEETLKTVDLAEVSNPFSIMALIDVPKQPFRSSSYTFAIEENVPVFYECNDFNIRFIDLDRRITTASRTYTDTRVKYEPGEIAILGPTGNTTTGVIPSNTIKLYKFDAEIGDSINIRIDKAAMFELYSPTAEPLIKAAGVDATKNRTLTIRQNGTHYVAVHDIATANSVTIDFSHINKFAFTEQEVTHTANRGCFEMEVKGNGFESLQKLTLFGNGREVDIEQYKIIDNYTLYAMIDLDSTTVELGDYRLKGRFTNIDNGTTEDILSSTPLVIEQPTPVEIDVEIETPRIAGTPYLAYIKVTNRSNVGVWGIPFNIAAQHSPDGGNIEFMDFAISIDEKHKDMIPMVHSTENLLNTGMSGSFAPTIIPYLAPGATNTYTIGLTGKPREIVTLYAWTGKPWSEEINEVMADDYDLTVIQEPFEGNLFTFTECCKLYYQLENGIYETEIPATSPTKRHTPIQPLFWNAARRVANEAARETKQGVGIAARSSNGAISKRIEGYNMLLEMTGSNEYVEQMRRTDQRMLLVGNDLIALSETNNNLVGNTQALLHLLNARAHWRESVSPDPNPTPRPISIYQSVDPNEMKGYLSPSGTNHIGIDVKTVTYTIEFENDPEIANASASTIKVTSDINGSHYNLSSLKANKLKIGNKEIELPAEHHFVKTLDMRPEINAIAELTFDFDTSTGVAEWKLRSLDPMTLDAVKYMDQGILPVNDDSGCGTGYLTFSVDLRPSVADNTTIESRADIIFDNNAPISTPVWTNITDFTVPSAHIVSQSTADNKNFDFIVEGSDSGSGIWMYDLYMYSNDSKKWIAVNTLIDSDTFSYSSTEVLENATFTVVAIDRAGNRQDITSLNLLMGDADGNGMVDVADVMVITNHFLGNDVDINLRNADVNADGVIDSQDCMGVNAIYLNSSDKAKIKKLSTRYKPTSK